MSALSIRHMNFTLHEMDHIKWAEEARIAAETPHVDWFDWLVERPAKRGKGRVVVTVLRGATKRQFADWWMANRRAGWAARVIFNPQQFRANALQVGTKRENKS